MSLGWSLPSLPILRHTSAGYTNSPVRGRRTCTGSRASSSDALNREVTYSDISAEDWERELKRLGLPEHLARHVVTIGKWHRAGRYDRLSDGVQQVTGRPAMSVREFVSLHADTFGGRRT